MPTIRQLLARVTADKKVTADEWDKELKPALDASRVSAKHAASPESRQVARLFTSDAFEVEAGARQGMRGYLLEHGYAAMEWIEGERTDPSTKPSATYEDLVASNVSETDVGFENLLRKAGLRDAKVSVGVLDSGFELDHDALSKKAWTNPNEVAGNGVDDDNNGHIDDVHGWDFVSNDNGLSGDEHGSHVAGIATGGTGRINAVLCRVIDPLDAEKVAAAIDYAASEGARVINMSFKLDSKAEVDAVAAAMARHPGVLFVKSAGNDGERLGEASFAPETYLASRTDIPNLLVVAASDAKGAKADYSNYGAPQAQVAIRGSEVFSAITGNRYETMDGTSMAAPNAANVAARALLLDPALTPTDLQTLFAGCTDTYSDWNGLVRSGGLLNMQKAEQVAALSGMLRRGKSEAEARTALGLRDLAPELVTLARKLAPAATPPTQR